MRCATFRALLRHHPTRRRSDEHQACDDRPCSALDGGSDGTRRCGHAERTAATGPAAECRAGPLCMQLARPLLVAAGSPLLRVLCLRAPLAPRLRLRPPPLAPLV